MEKNLVMPFLQSIRPALPKRTTPCAGDEAILTAHQELLKRNPTALVERYWWIPLSSIDRAKSGTAHEAFKVYSEQRRARHRRLRNDLELMILQIEFGIEKGWWTSDLFVHPGIPELRPDYVPFIPDTNDLVKEVAERFTLQPHRVYFCTDPSQHPYHVLKSVLE